MSKNVKTTEATPQIERFREIARSLGADEDEAAFEAKLAMIARQKPTAGAALKTGKKSIVPKK